MKTCYAAAAIVAAAILALAGLAHADTVVELVPPTTFERATGAPTTTSIAFPAIPGEVVVIIKSPATTSGLACSSATVSLNGKSIASPSKFKKAGASLRLTCKAAELNVLTVEIRGKPGSSLNVNVEQALPADVGKVVGPAGGSLGINQPGHPLNGFSIDIPSGALSARYVLTATHVVNEDSAQPMVRLEPGGLMFSKPVIVTMPYIPRGDFSGFFEATLGMSSITDLDSEPEALQIIDIDSALRVARAATTRFSYVEIDGDELFRRGGPDATVKSDARRVLLVHGFKASPGKEFAGMGDSRRTFSNLPELLADQGCDVWMLNYLTKRSLRTTSQHLRVAVSWVRTKSQLPTDGGVALVCHSMGGLVARAYLQGLDTHFDEGSVDALVTLGTPHNGSSFFLVRPPQNWIPSLYEMWPSSDFMDELNVSTDLESSVAYTVIFGELDGILPPDGDGVVKRHEAELSCALQSEGSPLPGYSVSHHELQLGHHALAAIEDEDHPAWPIICKALLGKRPQLRAALVAGGITVDGRLNDSLWANANRYTVQFENAVRGVAVDIYLAHDGTYLYVGLDTPIRKGWDAYSNMFIDGDNDGYWLGGTTTPWVDVAVMRGAPGAWSGYTRYAPGRPRGTKDPLWYPGVTPPSGYASGAHFDGTMSYEYRLPLSDLTPSLKNGVGIVFSVQEGYFSRESHFTYPATDAIKFSDPKAPSLRADVPGWANLIFERAAK